MEIEIYQKIYLFNKKLPDLHRSETIFTKKNEPSTWITTGLLVKQSRSDQKIISNENKRNNRSDTKTFNC
jgi:hypothetical protein